MAILQQNNAVFYHPLDDTVEFLQTQAWAGVSGFALGKVSNAMVGAPPQTPASLDGGNLGMEALFHIAGGAIDISSTALDATKFVVAYGDQSDFNRSKARVGTVSGTDITYGPPAQFLNTNAGSQISIATLSATKFVGVRSIGSSLTTASIGTVSGTTIVFGTETIVINLLGGTSSNAVTALSATAFVVVYGNSFAAQSDAKIGTVSGTNITLGNEVSFNNAAVIANNLSVTTLSATAFVVAYIDSTDLQHGTTRLGAVSGTVIAFGPEAEFFSTGVASKPCAVALSAIKFIVAYRDIAGRGTAKVGTVSGALIVFGLESEFAVNSDHISAVTLSATEFVVAYSDVNNASHGKAKVGTVFGTNITFGAETEFLSLTSAVDISVANLSATKFVVAYRDTSALDHGKANVMTTAAYPATVGAPRLAFASWSKSINADPPTTAPPTTTLAPTTAPASTTAPPLLTNGIAIGGSTVITAGAWLVGYRDSFGNLQLEKWEGGVSLTKTLGPTLLASGGTEVSIGGSTAATAGAWLVSYRDSFGNLQLEKWEGGVSLTKTLGPTLLASGGTEVSIGGSTVITAGAWLVGYRDSSGNLQLEKWQGGVSLTKTLGPTLLASGGAEVDIGGSTAITAGAWLVGYRDSSGNLQLEKWQGGVSLTKTLGPVMI